MQKTMTTTKTKTLVAVALVALSIGGTAFGVIMIRRNGNSDGNNVTKVKTSSSQGANKNGGNDEQRATTQSTTVSAASATFTVSPTSGKAGSEVAIKGSGSIVKCQEPGTIVGSDGKTKTITKRTCSVSHPVPGKFYIIDPKSCDIAGSYSKVGESSMLMKCAQNHLDMTIAQTNRATTDTVFYTIPTKISPANKRVGVSYMSQTLKPGNYVIVQGGGDSAVDKIVSFTVTE